MNILRGMLTLAVTAAIGVSSTAKASDDSWEFSIAPLYLWGKNINATAAGPSELPLSLDFKDDLLDNLEAAFAIHAEARKGNWTIFAEYNYAKLNPTSEFGAGPASIRADVDYRDTLWELGGSWAFSQSDRTRWEVLGGVRYYDQKIDVQLDTPGLVLLPLPSNISVGDSWWQPFGGVRVFTQLGRNWSFIARGDYAFRDSNNTSLNVFTTFDYLFRDWGSVFIGYRYLDTNYDNKSSGANRYAFDGAQQGPAVGLNFHF